MPSSNNTVAPATSPPPPIDPSQVQWDAPAAPTAAPTAAAGSTAAAGPIDPSQVQWDQPSIGRAAALFGGGIAEGAASLPIAAAQLAGNAQLGSDVTGSGEDTADAIINQNTPRPAAPTDNTVSALPAWMQYLDPNKIAGLLHKGLVSLGMPAAPASTGEQAAYNAGEGVGRVATAALAPETLPGALISSEAGEGAKTGVQAAGGGHGAQALADVAGSLATSVPSLVAATARGIVRGGSGSAMQDAIDSFAKSGVKPTVGQASGNRAIQGTENTLALIPGGAGVMERSAAAQRGALSSKVDNIVDNLSGGQEVTPTAAGTNIVAGVKQAATKTKADAGAAYDKVDTLVPPNTSVPPTQTGAALSRLTTAPPGAENLSAQLVSPKVKALASAFQTDMQNSGGSLPYSTLAGIKTQLGHQIDWSPFATDPENGALKQVWHAVRGDMNNGASAVSPEAAQAVNDANSLYAANRAKQSVLESVINKAGGPEQVYNSLMGTAKNGATTLNTVTDALDQPSRNLLAASVLRRMGHATPGMQDATGSVFSPDTFLTNWNRLSDEAKQTLFGNLPGGYSDSVDALANNISTLKQSGRVLANPSGSARAVAHGAFWMDLLGSIPTAIYAPHAALAEVGAALGAAGGSNIAARVLTSPRAVAWLAKKTALPVGRLLGSGAAALSTPQQPAGE